MIDANNEEQLFKNYEENIRQVMGEGSFGKVFLIRSIHTQAEFAMKKYSYYYLKKNGKDLSIQRSVRILQNLSHKCILKFIKYIITKDDSIYLFFQACKKGSLQSLKPILINSNEKLFIDFIVFELVEGLKYLKSVSVAHRDIKPSNIAFTSEGQAKIIDFDEAVCFTHNYIEEEVGKLPEFPEVSEHPIFVSRRSRAMSFVGTAIYMSPQMKCKTKTDERGDTWALGCIIYELLMNESLLVDFQDQGQLQTDIQSRLQTMKSQKIGEHYISLLQRILTIDPNQRITIDEVYNHSVFQKLRKNRQFYEHSKQRFKKLLRGNYSLMNPKTLTDALTVDLIGMKAGDELFSKLQTVVLINEKYSYDVRHLIGGAQYFKIKHVKDQNVKKYIFYDEIESIKIVNQYIVINVVPQEWSHGKDKTPYQLQIKHIYEDQLMLGRMYELMMKIFND